jgi:hypothetical protein
MWSRWSWQSRAGREARCRRLAHHVDFTIRPRSAAGRTGHQSTAARYAASEAGCNMLLPGAGRPIPRKVYLVKGNFDPHSIGLSAFRNIDFAIGATDTSMSGPCWVARRPRWPHTSPASSGPVRLSVIGRHTESHGSGGIECPGKSDAVQCGANHRNTESQVWLDVIRWLAPAAPHPGGRHETGASARADPGDQQAWLGPRMRISGA